MYNTTKILKKVLKEELSDIPIRDTLEHRTNFGAFIDILRGGKLKGLARYDFDLDRGKERAFISTARKGALPSAKKMLTMDKDSYEYIASSLSENIGYISFKLFTDRILGSHLTRGIRKKPVAEYPMLDYNIALNTLKNALPSEEKNHEKILNSIIKTIQQKTKTADRTPKLIQKSIEDVLGKEKLKPASLTNLQTILEGYLQKSSPFLKEKEERFVSNKKIVNIPLDHRLMQIEFLPKASDGENMLRILKKSSSAKKEFLSLMKKYDKVFLKNQEYDKVIEKIKNSIEPSVEDSKKE